MGLHCKKVVAIVPPPTSSYDSADDPLPVILVLPIWLRCLLAGLAVLLGVVFGIALALDPYQDGKVWDQGTHTQLGLPECTFKQLTKQPCPSCGMTTSFALLVRGDVWHSLKANAVGTGLAAFCLVLIPWCLACALRGRTYLVQSLEWAVTRLVVVFVVLMLLRWGIVLLLTTY
jgi:hypothetical protein